jgi:serine/threonine protein phosphatase PrpC
MVVKSAGGTDVGKLREANEDSFLIAPERKLYIVADGMGGASCGEVASAVAVEIVSNYVRKPPVPWPPEPGYSKGEIEILKALMQINALVKKIADKVV